MVQSNSPDASGEGTEEAADSEEVLTLHLYGSSLERQRGELGASAFDKSIGDFGDPQPDEITRCFRPITEESLACKDERVVNLLRILEKFGSVKGRDTFVDRTRVASVPVDGVTASY